MRRVLTILLAILLVIVSLGIGVFTADLPFWQRALQLPLEPDEIYLPTAKLGDPGEASAPVPAWQMGKARALDIALLEQAVSRSRESGARALLVQYRRELVVERYFVSDDAGSLLPATVVARPMVAMAIGVARGEGRIPTLDAPVSRFLTEWDDEPRGRITLRQLLEETSGLASGGNIRGLLQSHPLDDLATLPHFATSRGVRMLLGNDFQTTALGFRLEHEPGGFRNVSPANLQLAALVLERATGQPFETYVDTHLWRAVGAGHAEIPMDRRAGMPAAHCCWRATARDMLRIATLLTTDGRVGERQVLPAGWVAEMARPSRVSAETGLQLRRLQIEGQETHSSADDQGGAFWAIPSCELVVLSVGGQGASPPDDLPALLLRALLGDEVRK